MNMQTITRTSDIRAVGLCHSVQGTFNQLMGYIGEDPEEGRVHLRGDQSHGLLPADEEGRG